MPLQKKTFTTLINFNQPLSNRDKELISEFLCYQQNYKRGFLDKLYDWLTDVSHTNQHVFYKHNYGNKKTEYTFYGPDENDPTQTIEKKIAFSHHILRKTITIGGKKTYRYYGYTDDSLVKGGFSEVKIAAFEIKQKRGLLSFKDGKEKPWVIKIQQLSLRDHTRETVTIEEAQQEREIQHNIYPQSSDVMIEKPEKLLTIDPYLGKAFNDNAADPRITTLEEFLQVCLKSLFALYHFHSKGYVHYDIKPSNLLMNDNHEINLIDFNLSHIENNKNSLKSGRGTILYAPPEVFKREFDLMGRASDIFSLGVSLLRIGGGEGRGGAESKAEITNNIKYNKEDIKTNGFNPKFEAALPILKKMFQADANARPSIEELILDFNKLLPTLGPTVGPLFAQTAGIHAKLELLECRKNINKESVDQLQKKLVEILTNLKNNEIKFKEDGSPTSNGNKNSFKPKYIDNFIQGLDIRAFVGLKKPQELIEKTQTILNNYHHNISNLIKLREKLIIFKFRCASEANTKQSSFIQQCNYVIEDIHTLFYRIRKHHATLDNLDKFNNIIEKKFADIPRQFTDEILEKNLLEYQNKRHFFKVDPLHPTDEQKEALRLFLNHIEEKNRHPSLMRRLFGWLIGYGVRMIDANKVYRFKTWDPIKQKNISYKIELTNPINVTHIEVGGKDVPRFQVIADELGRGTYGQVNLVTGSLKEKKGQFVVSDKKAKNKRLKVIKIQHHQPFYNLLSSTIAEAKYQNAVAKRSMPLIVEHTSAFTQRSYLYNEFYDGERIRNLFGSEEKPSTLTDANKNDPQWFLDIAINMLNEIENYHNSRVHHHDIWPNNILVNQTTREVHIIDTGSAKDANDLFQYGGNHEYRAPEKYRFPFLFSDGKKADIYSYGRALNNLWPLVSHHNLGSLKPLLAKLIHDDPKQRPDTQEIFKELEEIKLSLSEPNANEQIRKKIAYQIAGETKKRLFEIYHHQYFNNLTQVKQILASCRKLRNILYDGITNTQDYNVTAFVEKINIQSFKSLNQPTKADLLNKTVTVTRTFEENITALCNHHDQTVGAIQALKSSTTSLYKHEEENYKQLKLLLGEIKHLIHQIDQRRFTFDNLDELNNKMKIALENISKQSNAIKRNGYTKKTFLKQELISDISLTTPRVDFANRTEELENKANELRNRIRLALRHYLAKDHSLKSSNQHRLEEVSDILAVVNNQALNKKQIKAEVKEKMSRINTAGSFFNRSKLRDRVEWELKIKAPKM